MTDLRDQEQPAELRLRGAKRRAGWASRRSRRQAAGRSAGYHAMLVVAVISLATVLGATPLLLRLILGR